MRARLIATASAVSLAGAGPAVAVDVAVARVGADQTRTLFGDGTGVVVGIVDSGIDDLHPALVGTDSLGRTRLIGEQNFVPGEFGPDDVFGHGTFVMGVVGSADSFYRGPAPDTRYVNARVLDDDNGFGSTATVEDGSGFAIDQGSDLLNLSLGTNSSLSSGNLDIDRQLDYAASQRNVLSIISAGNDGNDSDPQPGSPAGSFNGITVGATSSSSGYNRVVSFSSTGPTDDGRGKPDIVAPGQSITSLNDDWETQSDFSTGSGTSYAAPIVTGVLAQQIDFGRAQGLSTDGRVLKATMLNSAEKVQGKSGQAWAPGDASTVNGVYRVTAPLDPQQGVGQVDVLALYDQYTAGEQDAGEVNSLGWDLGTVGSNGLMDYVFEQPLEGGSLFTTTMSWFRDVLWNDNGNGLIDRFDSYTTFSLRNLNLSLLFDGTPVAESVSPVDTVEHLSFALPETGFYTLRVEGLGAGSTKYGLAWDGVSRLLADADGDGQVNLADFGILRANFGTMAGYDFGDFTGDGIVNLADFGVLRANFGASSAADLALLDAWAATVPEPATMALFPAAALLLRRRRTDV